MQNDYLYDVYSYRCVGSNEWCSKRNKRKSEEDWRRWESLPAMIKIDSSCPSQKKKKKKCIEYDTFNLSSSVDNTSKTVKENCSWYSSTILDIMFHIGQEN